MTKPRWTFEARLGGVRRDTALELFWEVDGDPLTDDYTPDEADAANLLGRWARKQKKTISRVWWFVQGDGTFESAPFLHADNEDFLTHFTWPVNTKTGEPVRWASLPVVDKLWNEDRADKGGFIQQATGWKPGPFQTTLDWPLLLRLSGFEGMITAQFQ